MTNPCQTPCVRERQKFDANSPSPGPVGADEALCRALFGDSYNANPPTLSDGSRNYVKAAAVSKKQLREGEISVWRISIDASFGASEAEKQTRASGIAETRKGIVAMCELPAHELRNLTAIGFEHTPHRALSILDDTRTDHNGNHHKCHANLALCERIATIADPNLQETMVASAKEQLQFLLRRKLPSHMTAKASGAN